MPRLCARAHNHGPSPSPLPRGAPRTNHVWFSRQTSNESDDERVEGGTGQPDAGAGGRALCGLARGTMDACCRLGHLQSAAVHRAVPGRPVTLGPPQAPPGAFTCRSRARAQRSPGPVRGPSRLAWSPPQQAGTVQAGRHRGERAAASSRTVVPPAAPSLHRSLLGWGQLTGRVCGQIHGQGLTDEEKLEAARARRRALVEQDPVYRAKLERQGMIPAEVTATTFTLVRCVCGPRRPTHALSMRAR